MGSSDTTSSIMECSWKTDGSDGATLNANADSDEGSVVVVVDGSNVHSPVNVMAESSNKIFPDSFWFSVKKMEFLDGDSSNLSVGVVSNDDFFPGWKTKGMFYNGNLTNGGAALETGWGPYLKSGDSCALECISSENSFAVTFYVNGKRIGKGFEITGTTKKYFPCVSVNGKVKFTAKITTEPTSDLLSLPEETNHPLSGDWIIKEAKTETGDQYLPLNPEELEEGDPRDITMTIDTTNINDGTIAISVKAANSMGISKGCKLRPTEEDPIVVYDLSKRDPGIMTTRMMTFPPYDRVERGLSEAMSSGWKSIRVLNVDEGGENDDVELSFMGGENGNVVFALCVKKQNGDEAALTSYYN